MYSTANFEKWAEGKHPFLAMISHSLAVQSKMAYGFTKIIHDEDLFLEDLPFPDLDSWLKLFRTHKDITKYFFQLFENLSEHVNATEKALSGLTKESSQQINKSDLEIIDSEKILNEYLQAHKTVVDDAVNLSTNEIENFIVSPEFYFLCRVIIPCETTHFTAPAILYRKARLRDFESLKKLVSLDPSTIFDTRIARFIHELRNKNRAKYDQIFSLIHNKSNAKISRWKFKAFYAAIITNFSIQIGQKLTEPEIRDLFDAVARDEGKGEIDTDLPETPDTFYKAIKRHLHKSNLSDK